MPAPNPPRAPIAPRSLRPSHRRVRFALPLLVPALATGLAASPANDPAADDPFVGFTTDGAAWQAQCEARFLELPSGDSFREHLREITSEPHPTGSARQVEVGRYLARVMREAGLEVREHPYDVYLPQLTDDVEAWIVAPDSLRLSNREPALAEDRFSGHPGLLNGWNAFSGSGDVSGEVVYANFGRREDYEALDSMGIDLTGRIVIARYGGNFRGYKVKFAEERGAAGVIMFNDPGFSREGAYPEGPMMNGETIQRGSVLTLPWTGDPLTPFEPALPLDDPRPVTRLDPDSVGLHTIPVLPLGYLAASEILSRMDGPEAPSGWQGGLEMPYRLLGGEALRVRVRVNQPKALTRAVNVVGTLEGTEFPDEWIVLGAHYDPWAFGAIDPNGGTAMLLTLAEALGALAEDGCRPRRSILIAHWDAEEAGIIGSTEWVEEFRDELQANAVAYLNADGAVSGPNFGGSSSPSLKGTILDVLDDVPYPGTDLTVRAWWEARAGAGGAELGNLGGGSDHVAFYTHAGIPSAGLSTGAPSGVYHSNYDNFAWFERFGDVDFVFGPMLARVDGMVALRLANADLLPYDVMRYATDTRTHVATLDEVAVARGIGVDLSRLVAATGGLEDAARAFETARDAALAAGIDATRAAGVNAVLRGLEKAWLHPDGLQDRPWSRSLYVSPDPFSGYASWMLPGIRFEIETDDPDGVPAWEEKYLAAIDDLTARVREATARLDGGPGGAGVDVARAGADAGAAATAAMGASADLIERVDQAVLDRAKLVQVMIDKIFSFAELGHREFETSGYVTRVLEENGFTVERGVSGMPTAWVARWGSGSPVIAFGSDIDGIPKASQTPGVAYHQPLVDGAPGHGEGHNAGQGINVAAALAVKQIMEEERIEGTLVLWPGVAEEQIASKAWFVRDGLFDDVDAVLFTHVSNNLSTSWGPANGTGLVSVEFTFSGESAHAAGAPWRGRSALDAVELMNTGWNYWREHMNPMQRSHYVITDGGDQPNVVPSKASVWYYIREIEYEGIQANYDAAVRIAEGAALMSDTEMSYRVRGAAWPRHFNRVIAETMDAHIQTVGLPEWSEADHALAEAVQREVGSVPTGLATSLSRMERPSASRTSGGSDDIGDISWTVPTVTLRFPSNIPGLPGHHWSNAISMATPIAHKGGVAGARVMARTALQLFLEPGLVEGAWAYFRDEQRAEDRYRSFITADDPPPIDLNEAIDARFRPQLEKFYFDETRFDTYLEQLGITYPTVRGPGG